MATDFKIRHGPASDLFIDNTVGVFERKIKPNLHIEVGCWYLTSDTAELFLGVALDDGSSGLKCINGESISAVVAEIKKELNNLNNLGTIQLYCPIETEGDLPTDFDSPSFNPNVVYYIRHNTAGGQNYDTCSTYVFDIDTGSYLRSGSIDIDLITKLVAEAVQQQLDTNELTNAIASNTESIATLTGSATTAGSIAYAIAVQATADANTYATKSAIGEIEAALANKVDSGFILHTPIGAAEEVSVEGTALKIAIDAYTKAETIAKIEEKIAGIVGNDAANTVASNLAAYIESNDAVIAAVKTAINANKTDITELALIVTRLAGDASVAGSVQNIVTEAIASIPMATGTTIGLVKASAEVSVAADGSMSIGYISTDKLVQGSGLLVLNGGCAEL